MLHKTMTTFLSTVGRLPDLLRSARSSSLIEYTQPARAEPITLVDERFILLPYSSDIMQSVLSIFAGYYLQAAAISSTMNSVKVIEMLERLNPARSPAENAGLFIGEVTLANESYKHRLPNISKIRHSLESSGYPDEDEAQPAMTLARDTRLTAQSVTNLAVGMLLEVNFDVDGTKMTVPVSIRLLTSAIPPDSLNHILSYAQQDKSVKERLYGWMAGDKDTFNDMILCNDLVDAHRKALMDDKSGVYREILRRRNGNRISAIFSGNPSISTASNIAILTADTAAELQTKVGGSLDKYAIRDAIFKNTYLMLIVVVDTRFEQVTIYHRGIHLPTHLSVKEMKNASKSNGPDVSEILKAYQLGNAPTF